MSKMGQMLVEVQERHYAGQDPAQIAKETNTSVSFVRGFIDELEASDGEAYSYPDEWPEPESDF